MRPPLGLNWTNNGQSRHQVCFPILRRAATEQNNRITPIWTATSSKYEAGRDVLDAPLELELADDPAEVTTEADEEAELVADEVVLGLVVVGVTELVVMDAVELVVVLVVCAPARGSV